MDPFTVILLGGSAGLVLALLLVARPTPRARDGRPQGAPPAGSASAPSSGEPDDLAQLLEATNRRRRRRGEPERSAGAVRADLAAEVDVLRDRP